MDYEKVKLIIVIVASLLIIGAIILLSFIEEMDMKEINKLFMNLNLCDPIEVMEYFTVCSSKPTWRVALIFSLAYALFLTAMYIMGMQAWVFFFMTIPVTWVVMSSYLSYFNFHVWTPSGGKENWNKYKHACMRNVKMKFQNE